MPVLGITRTLKTPGPTHPTDGCGRPWGWAWTTSDLDAGIHGDACWALLLSCVLSNSAALFWVNGSSLIPRRDLLGRAGVGHRDLPPPLHRGPQSSERPGVDGHTEPVVGEADGGREGEAGKYLLCPPPGGLLPPPRNDCLPWPAFSPLPSKVQAPQPAFSNRI